ncbi:uncharacterized protein EV422DRAFT_201015 [Fimicolochytrium jonesii]|uniref:uncharacterized protein n=1 Tax=Fimicolochytrium jonesii TaxID=1396493 RepID=UPI0022FE2681|nr:uncharacterized protein EV422DRAFT_201015 [Fimicolochytrium jonesii]KAI8817987.1 hypothetical protein EV422DRAFT_201015 [Fimicolochytrium jonesii]
MTGEDGDGELHPLAPFFMTGRFADALVRLKSSSFQTAPCPVHRVILASKSPVFEDLFEHAPESYEKGEIGEDKQIKDTTQAKKPSKTLGIWTVALPDDFSLRLVLEWCYFSSISKVSLTATNCWKVRMAAQQFAIGGLIYHVDLWVSRHLLDGTVGDQMSEEEWCKVLAGALKSRSPDDILRGVVDRACSLCASSVHDMNAGMASHWEYTKYRFLRRVITKKHLELTPEEVKRLFSVSVTFTQFDIPQLAEAHEDVALPRDIIADALMRSLISRSSQGYPYRPALMIDGKPISPTRSAPLSPRDSDTSTIRGMPIVQRAQTSGNISTASASPARSFTRAVTSADLNSSSTSPVRGYATTPRLFAPSKTPSASASPVRGHHIQTFPRQGIHSEQLLHGDTPISTVLANIRHRSLERIPTAYRLSPNGAAPVVSAPVAVSPTQNDIPNPNQLERKLDEFPDVNDDVSDDSPYNHEDVSMYEMAPEEFPEADEPAAVEEKPEPAPIASLSAPSHNDKPQSQARHSPPMSRYEENPLAIETRSPPADRFFDRDFSMTHMHEDDEEDRPDSPDAEDRALYETKDVKLKRGLSILEEGPSFSDIGPLLALREMKNQVRALMDEKPKQPERSCSKGVVVPQPDAPIVVSQVVPTIPPLEFQPQRDTVTKQEHSVHPPQAVYQVEGRKQEALGGLSHRPSTPNLLEQVRRKLESVAAVERIQQQSRVGCNAVGEGPARDGATEERGKETSDSPSNRENVHTGERRDLNGVGSSKAPVPSVTGAMTTTKNGTEQRPARLLNKQISFAEFPDIINASPSLGEDSSGALSSEEDSNDVSAEQTGRAPAPLPQVNGIHPLTINANPNGSSSEAPTMTPNPTPITPTNHSLGNLPISPPTANATDYFQAVTPAQLLGIPELDRVSQYRSEPDLNSALLQYQQQQQQHQRPQDPHQQHPYALTAPPPNGYRRSSIDPLRAPPRGGATGTWTRGPRPVSSVSLGTFPKQQAPLPPQPQHPPTSNRATTQSARDSYEGYARKTKRATERASPPTYDVYDYHFTPHNHHSDDDDGGDHHHHDDADEERDGGLPTRLDDSRDFGFLDLPPAADTPPHDYIGTGTFTSVHGAPAAPGGKGNTTTTATGTMNGTLSSVSQFTNGTLGKGTFRMLGFQAAGSVAKFAKAGARKRKGIVDLFKGA